MKKKKPKWRVVEIRSASLYMSGHCSGPGYGNRGYYYALYDVTEQNENTHEFRKRVIKSEPCRIYGEGYEAILSLFDTYMKNTGPIPKIKPVL